MSPEQISPEVSKTGNNWIGFKSDELTQLINQERTTVKATDAETKAARKEIFKKIQKLYSDHMVTYFMWADSDAQGFSTNIGGVRVGPNGDMNYIDQGRSPIVFREWYLKNAK
jgi:ABC-type transport system substrate-binding protein